jgi:hypothetical protein
MTQQEIEAIQAQRRAEHEAKMQVLHAQEVEIQKQQTGTIHLVVQIRQMEQVIVILKTLV